MNEEGIRRDVAVLGGSAGALAALKTILAGLPARLPATLAIVVHRSATFESRLAELLGRLCPLPVGEPGDGEPICRGRIVTSTRNCRATLYARWRTTSVDEAGVSRMLRGC